MIIAEIGLNHLGSMRLAETYIEELVQTDIDGITFQIREKEYYLNSEKFYLELQNVHYLKLACLTKSANKQFGVAVADIEKIDFLESIDVDFYKIIRNDITNTELVEKVIATGKKVIISTGMSSDSDIEIFMDKFGDNNIVLNHTQLSNEPSDILELREDREKVRLTNKLTTEEVK